MRIARPCYDKYHRCPGWAGPGVKTREHSWCRGGYIFYDTDDKWWRWKPHTCNRCSTVVLPYHVRWLDLGWWRWEWLDLKNWVADVLRRS